MGYELVISSGNNGAATDTPSGVYRTRLEAMEALKEAAKVDGLTVRCGATSKIGLRNPQARFDIGCLVDSDGEPRFRFQIREVSR